MKEYVPLTNFYVNGTLLQDIAGNFIQPEIMHPIQDIAGNIVHPEEINCSICNKKIRVGLIHNKCRRIQDKYERAKQKLLETEFQLFCLKCD
jgi:hypothetical protein